MITTEQRIVAKCNELMDLLIEKNGEYGDSYSAGVRIMSQASPLERIRCRLDEKLNRLANGKQNKNDIMDLAGLFVMFEVQRDIADGK